jgi:hypothetical protein
MKTWTRVDFMPWSGPKNGDLLRAEEEAGFAVFVPVWFSICTRKVSTEGKPGEGVTSDESNPDGILSIGAVIPSRRLIVALFLLVLLVAALAAPDFGDLLAILTPLLVLIALVAVLSERTRGFLGAKPFCCGLALHGPRPPPLLLSFSI